MKLVEKLDAMNTSLTKKLLGTYDDVIVRINPRDEGAMIYLRKGSDKEVVEISTEFVNNIFLSPEHELAAVDEIISRFNNQVRASKKEVQPKPPEVPKNPTVGKTTTVKKTPAKKA